MDGLHHVHLPCDAAHAAEGPRKESVHKVLHQVSSGTAAPPLYKKLVWLDGNARAGLVREWNCMAPIQDHLQARHACSCCKCSRSVHVPTQWTFVANAYILHISRCTVHVCHIAVLVLQAVCALLV